MTDIYERVAALANQYGTAMGGIDSAIASLQAGDDPKAVLAYLMDLRTRVQKGEPC